jgi:serine/threonine protein kinase
MGWLVPGLHAQAHQWQTSTEYVKAHINPPQFDAESRLLQIAHAVGCAPAFEIEAPMTIRLRLYTPLLSWLAKSTPGEIQAMAHRVLDQVRTLHQAGVCHRDLKATDIVVDGDQPLLIDFELGTEVNPFGPCYDLLGPQLSGVPLPPIHDYLGLREGVWWDTQTEHVRPLWRDLGRLADADSG